MAGSGRPAGSIVDDLPINKFINPTTGKAPRAFDKAQFTTPRKRTFMMPASMIQREHNMGTECHFGRDFSQLQADTVVVAAGQNEGC
jgi:hypothetical protein